MLVRPDVFRRLIVKPGDTQRVLVVDRHAPFELLAEIKADRPQHEAPSGPKFAVLRLALAKAPISMAVFNLVKRCGRPSGGKDGRGEPGLGGGTTTRTQNTL